MTESPRDAHHLGFPCHNSTPGLGDPGFEAVDPDVKGDPDEDKEHCSGNWPKRVVVSHVLEGEVGFVGLLQPGHQDSARDDVVVRRLSGADVEVQLGIMVSEHVRDKGEDGRERDADDGDALCDDLVVQMHHVLPLEDVEVLD